MPRSLHSPIICSSVTGFPCAYFCWYIFPFLLTSTVNSLDKAFVTEIPTPCKPPETLYVFLSNLPPACNFVITISTAGLLYLGCKSTGMPLPLSITAIELSLWIVTLILLQNPARASSMLLSTASKTRWCRPLKEVSPMYMLGRFLTALKPARTWMSFAP